MQFASPALKKTLKTNRVFFILIILMICVLCYSHLPFLMLQQHWDDQWVVVNWFTESGLSPDNVWSIFTSYYHGQYAPINQLYYTLIYGLWGYNPIAFHTGGLVLHLANVFLVYKLIYKFVVVLKLGPQAKAYNIALLSCLIFAIHPLFVEPTAWISASKVLLYALFYFLGMIMYLNYLSSNKKKYLLYVYLCFMLSFFAKEQGATLPFSLLLIDNLYFKEGITKRSLIEKLPFFALCFFFAFITMQSQANYNQGILTNNNTYPILYRICYAFYAISEYVLKSILPLKLLYYYPFPNAVSQPIPPRLFLYPLIIPAIIYGFWDLLKLGWVRLGIVFFIINIVMVLHIMPISRVAIIADRYTYVATVGIIFLISYFLNVFLLPIRKYRSLVFIGLFIYLIYLGAFTYLRVPIWNNSYTLKNSLKSETKQL